MESDLYLRLKRSLLKFGGRKVGARSCSVMSGILPKPNLQPWSLIGGQISLMSHDVLEKEIFGVIFVKRLIILEKPARRYMENLPISKTETIKDNLGSNKRKPVPIKRMLITPWKALILVRNNSSGSTNCSRMRKQPVLL